MGRTWALAALLSVTAWTTVGGTTASACTGNPVSIGWLADHAAQVIVCEVAEVHSRWTDGDKRIESDVTLSNIQYLKGRPDDARAAMPLTLSVPGGTVGDTTMRLCCTPDLAPGQRWLIFLQPEYRTYPAAGMGQGILEIRLDADATPRVFAPGGRPIVGIDDNGIPVSAAPAPPARVEPEPVGTRGGVRVHPREPAARAAVAEPAAMTLETFIREITPTLNASRTFDLAQPAGRRIEAELTPVPLGVVPGAPAPEQPSAGPRRSDDVPRADPPSPKTPASTNQEATR